MHAKARPEHLFAAEADESKLLGHETALLELDRPEARLFQLDCREAGILELRRAVPNIFQLLGGEPTRSELLSCEAGMFEGGRTEAYRAELLRCEAGGAKFARGEGHRRLDLLEFFQLEAAIPEHGERTARLLELLCVETQGAHLLYWHQDPEQFGS